MTRSVALAALVTVAWIITVGVVVGSVVHGLLPHALAGALATSISVLAGVVAAAWLGFGAWTWAGWPGRVAIAHRPVVGSPDTVRVLHVCDFAAPYPGAFIGQLRMLAEDIAARGAGRCSFAFPARAEGRPWLEALRADGYDVHLLPEPSARPTRAQVRAIARLVGALRPDVVHAHFGTYDLAVARALRGLSRRGVQPAQVWHYRTALETTVQARDAKRRIKDLVRYRWGGRSVDIAIGVTEAMGVEVAARGLGRRGSAIVAGTDTDRFTPDEAARDEVRRELGLGDDDVLVLHLGWHWQRKGGDLLAAAARQLEDERVDGPRIVVCSIGAPADEVESPVRALEPTDEVQRLHQASDVFVSASRSEGFGNGLVEAMACARVAIATLADGQRELFEQVDGVRTVQLEDASGIADQLAWLVQHRDQWPALGAANRAHVVANNSMRRWARQMADAYEALRPRLGVLDHVVAPTAADAVPAPGQDQPAATDTPAGDSRDRRDGRDSGDRGDRRDDEAADVA